jgi:hypothetical protein
MDRPYEPQRLKNLIHYVIQVAGARPHFGAVKLYKTLWFSDARRFVLTGMSITGAPYIREKYGPLPRDGMRFRNELASDGAIRQWQNDKGGALGWHFKSLSNPDIAWIDLVEKEEVDRWIKVISDKHTAESISDESHDYGWQIAKMGERLPFISVLAERAREPSGDEMKWARERAKALGLP